METLFQDSKTNVGFEDRAELLVLSIAGQLNETLDFGPIQELFQKARSTRKKVEIDFSAINRVNSAGLRNWLLFLQDIPNDLEYGFSLVNEYAVHQAAVVPAFFGRRGTPVQKFEIPFYCRKCRKRFSVVFANKDVRFSQKGSPETPKAACETCKGGADFDALASEYFNFILHSLAKPR